MHMKTKRIDKPSSPSKARFNRDTLCEKLSITYDYIHELVFEIGCDFIERWSQSYDSHSKESITKKILTNKEFGYWMWFLNQFSHSSSKFLLFTHRLSSDRLNKTFFETWIKDAFEEEEMQNKWNITYQKK